MPAVMLPIDMDIEAGIVVEETTTELRGVPLGHADVPYAGGPPWLMDVLGCGLFIGDVGGPYIVLPLMTCMTDDAIEEGTPAAADVDVSDRMGSHQR